MAFALNYYEHYPKIGLGVWPPVFYVVQAFWTLAFGASRLTLLQLMAVLAASVAALIARFFREEEKLVGLVLGLSFLLLPLARELYSMVMAETLSGLLMLAAAMAFARFLDREERRDGVLFGVLAGLAILTKGTGLALALMAPLAILISRRWSVLKNPTLWGGALITALLAGPWTWKFKDLGRGGWLQPSPSWSFTREALPYYLDQFSSALGILVLLVMMSGVLVLCWRRQFNEGRWAVCAALILAILLFQSLVPVGLEARHLVPALPPALVLCAAAFPRVRRPWLAALLLLAFITCAAAGSRARFKDARGFGPLADWLVRQAQPADRFLVSSDATGEGMFISEVALRDSHRPSYTVQRASKALAVSEWSGSGYQQKYHDDAELDRFFATGAIHYVVLDLDVPAEKKVAHIAQLETFLDSHRAEFDRLSSWPSHRDGHPGMLVLYRYHVPAPKN
jgi:hypothetical protein